MNILHYTLGLPPYRSGGLTKYSFDIIKEQNKNENVFVLFPGIINGKETSIKYYKNKYALKAFEIVNPQPVPLLDGISEPKLFMKKGNNEAYKKFLVDNKIEILHIHTLMGLHLEFLEEARNQGIKIFFTSHDYFGICPKVNFININGEVCENHDFKDCYNCNANAQSINKIKILQSYIYREAKNMGLIKYTKKYLGKIKGNKSNDIKADFVLEKRKEDEALMNDYKELEGFYLKLFSYVDKFIFNSSVSQKIYSKYFENVGEIVSITHSDIKDKRKKKNYKESDILNLVYLGPMKKYKGFDLLIDAINKLSDENKSKLKLSIYGDSRECKVSENIISYGTYNYNELEGILDKADAVIVPSICYETFGFIALEAISFGVTVILSEKVGAKDIIVKNDLGFVMKDNINSVKDTIENILDNRSSLREKNDNILNCDIDFSLYSHCIKLKEVYLTVK